MNSRFRIVENPSPQTWDALISAQGGHLLQTAAWGELKTRFGWSALRIALEYEDRLAAGAQILFRSLPLGLTLGYVPRGPVVDPADRAAGTALAGAVVDAARARGAFALKVEPNGPAPLPFWSGRIVPAAGIQPRTTIHVDLTRDLDAILAGMKTKWRYNIRLAERKGVQVRAGTASDVATFYHLLQITGERDHFAVHSLAYYRAAFDLLGDHACLFLAEYAGEPLAAIFVTAFAGEAIYLYGASGNAHRERMPNHALHWAAIQWACGRGCARYDLWGVPDVAPNSPEPNAPSTTLPDGLYQFKQGFGGTVVRYAGASDLIFSRVPYALYRRALALRRGHLG